MHHQIPPNPNPLPSVPSQSSTPTRTTSPSPHTEDLEEHSTTADDGIAESHETFHDVSFPSPLVGATAPPRQRRRYEPAERQEVKAVRALGACRHCRKKRIKCQHARALLKSMLEGKENSATSDVQIPSNHSSTQYSSLEHSADSGYLSGEDRKTSLRWYATDMSSGGNPVTWHLQTHSPSQMDDEVLFVDDAQSRTDSVAELWLVDSEGQVIPPQDDLASYMPITTKAMTQQQDDTMEPFFLPFYCSLEVGSMQQNYDDSSKLLRSVSGTGLPLLKDLTSYFPTGDEPPLQVHYAHVPLPGEGIPFRVRSGIHSVQPERARPAVISSRRNSTNRVQRPRRRGGQPSYGRRRPQVPQLVTETSLASTASDVPSVRSVDLSSPLDHLSLQSVPEQQTSPRAQENWRPVPTLQDQISSSNFIPQVFSPLQYAPVLPPIPSLGMNPPYHENNMSSPPFGYQQSMHEHSANQHDMGYDLPANDVNADYDGMNYPQFNQMQQDYPQMTDVYGQATQYNPAWMNNQPSFQSSSAWSTPPYLNFSHVDIASGPPSLTTNTTDSLRPVPSPPNLNAPQPSAYFPPSNDSFFQGLEPTSVGQGYGSTWQDPQAIGYKEDEMSMEELLGLLPEH